MRYNMKCTACGNELDQETKFCPWCGEKIKSTCSKCNTELPEGVRFCPSCGSAVSENVAETGTDTVDIVLKSAGEDREKIVRIIREFTGLELKVVKDIVDSLEAGNEFVMYDIPKDKVDEVMRELRQNGTIAETDGGNLGAQMDIAGKETDKDIKEDKEIKRVRTKIGFKGTLLIAFISFFLPFCTVSCGSETIISPSGYELAGDLGMTEEQMELYELTPEDTMNKAVVLLIIIMVGSLIATEAKKVIGMTCLAGTAALFLQRIPYDDKWNELRAVGCEVTFEFGYWLAFIMLVLTTLAFLWAPGIIGKVEEVYVHGKEDQTKKNQLRETMDGGLSAAILIIIVVAVATNWNSVKSWGGIFQTRKVPDLRENYGKR